MARKKIELFSLVDNEKDFENALNQYRDLLICAEIYCEWSGYCVALDRLFTRIKLDWGSGQIVLLRVLADTIPALSRLQNQSEPFYMFIMNKKVTQVFIGVDSMRFEDTVRKELNMYLQAKEGLEVDRPTYEINEPTPGEIDWLNAREEDRQMELKSIENRHATRQAFRKKHRAEIMAPYLQQLDFVLYWPQAIHAHPELYERWDANNIIMVGREELELTKEQALDILYNGDAPINEASMHALLSGKSLAICLRALDPVHLVTLVRKILYEDDIHLDKDGKKSPTLAPTTPYDYYKTYSLTREEIYQKRREERIRQKEEEKERRARQLSEIIRLTKQARLEAIEAKKAATEQKKMELLKAGNLEELEALKKEDIDDYGVDVVIPEEDSYVSEEESDIEEDPDEYIPPAGLPIPGFYSPPNDIAKANGLAILFPKLVQEHVARTPPDEFLPPHVLVMLNMNKRYKVIVHMMPYKHGIIHMGIFKTTGQLDAKHVAYSVKQFDALGLNTTLDDYKLCLMVSTKVDLPLLELTEFNPIHVSRDTTAGEDECAALFPVHYGEEYPEFEDFEVEKEEV